MQPGTNTDGKKFHIKCSSKYFCTKYGSSTPIIIIEEESELEYNPPSFLYQGRVLAEGRRELLKGKIYYGHVNGLGEFVHESELGEEVTQEGST